MNKYIEMFMKDNDLEVEEKFKIKSLEETFPEDFWFNEDGTLIRDDGCNCYVETTLLLNGIYKVEKLKKGPWKPKKGEHYYFVTFDGSIIGLLNLERPTDKYALSHKLVFKTKEEAEDYKWFLEKVDEHKKPFVLDGANHVFRYDLETSKVSIDHCSHMVYQGNIFFGSQENIKDFKREVGVGRIKRYMFGVYD